MTQEIVAIGKSEEKFAVDDVIGTGWQITWSRFWPLICILGVNGLVAALIPLASFVMGYNGAMTMSNISLQLLMHLLSAVTWNTAAGSSIARASSGNASESSSIEYRSSL